MGLYELKDQIIVHTHGGRVEEIIPIEEAELSRYIEVGEGGVLDGGDNLDLERKRRNGESFQVDCRRAKGFPLPDIEVLTTIHYLPSRDWICERMCSLRLPGDKVAERLLKLEGILGPDEYIWR